MYKSVTAQTLHYFARPHRAPRTTLIDGPAAWRGCDLATSSAWRHPLSADDIAELDGALGAARSSGRPLRELRAVDLPLPTLAAKIGEWRREVADGRGFVLVQGFPVERWGPEDSAIVFYGLGLHLGIPGAQNPEGDLLGHVRDTGADPRHVRAYRTASNIAYHCDAADLVGLLCLETARSGGLSRIVSSITVYNTLLAEQPELVERLYRPFLLDTHGEGGVDYFPIPACRFAGDRLRTFWHSDYFRSSHDYERAPAFEPVERAVLDAYDAIASRPELYLDMELAKGDAQFLSNHTILHARTAYEDHIDPARQRHLLRLWVSLDAPRRLRDRTARLRSVAPLITALVRARITRAVRGRSPRRAEQPVG
ncbi:MAG: TauD/TfdA family dioxygenase [Deltaproteobacteria bacterium]|nr:MAG: TauD/TfdA family dioxygenase [Deltaproteobacteria bacterium]TMQ12915.1 MAG: TauD/TfdA family dioxygenase [Deltaproteobacteria bacterium]